MFGFIISGNLPQAELSHINDLKEMLTQEVGLSVAPQPHFQTWPLRRLRMGDLRADPVRGPPSGLRAALPGRPWTGLAEGSDHLTGLGRALR